MAIRRPRKAVLVSAGNGPIDRGSLQALAAALAELGIESSQLGRETSAARIAATVLEQEADAVEVCLSGLGGIPLLRDLLRELIRAGRRDVSIVVHRAEWITSGVPDEHR
jgi:methylmalonyl-CoA mutase cobalamin-binding subunit